MTFLDSIQHVKRVTHISRRKIWTKYIGRGGGVGGGGGGEEELTEKTIKKLCEESLRVCEILLCLIVPLDFQEQPSRLRFPPDKFTSVCELNHGMMQGKVKSCA